MDILNKGGGREGVQSQILKTKDVKIIILKIVNYLSHCMIFF